MADIFVVLVSGSLTNSEDQAKGMEGGADGYIAQPIANREFLARIQAFLRIKAAEQTLKKYSLQLEDMVADRTQKLHAAEEYLVRQERLAMLGQMAGSVGHELRNPLAVINNAIYYLKLIQPEADVKVKDYLNMIERETRTAEKIINDLLNFARVKSAERAPVSIPALVERVLERFPLPASMEAVLNLPDSLPLVYADSLQVEQVLGNLILNACQAMPDGGQISISSEQLSMNGEQWVIISVKDTGTGITPENMTKLFEPLFTTKTKGIGLGLPVSKKLIEANNGRIEVQSEPGKGSMFMVYLPVHDGY